MVRFFSIFLIIICFFGGMATAQPADHVPGRLLVQRAEKADASTVAMVLALHGAKVHHDLPEIGVSVLEIPEQAADAIAQSLGRTGLFQFVERDYLAGVSATPNDPDFASQWHLAKIQAASAWGVTQGSTGVSIAIIDSGADPTHPDLKPKLLSGWNFLNGSSNTSDTMGHGTAVAGAAAAATDNLTGVAGVGWANPILPLVAVDSTGYASYSNIASAIDYAADHGSRIISISIAGSSASSTLQSAVNYAWSKGAVIFAAAGNNSSSTCMYPACCTNVLAISATEPTDTLASFSNYGSWIALSAPGDTILTTMNGGGYGSWWGTSLATPIAAAVGALALSANPSLTNSALVTLLEKNSDDLGAAGHDNYFGWGRVNAYKAVTAAKGGTTTDTTPPAVSISSPLTGATASGTVSVKGTATDNVGVTSVQLYVDGVLAGSTTVSSFSFSWNSTAVTNGTHMLMVKAFDAASNVGSVSISVNVSNDKTVPTVSIASPTTGATVSGTIAVTGSATDNVGVTKVQLFVDGVATLSGTTSPFSFSWNTTTATNAAHTLTVKAYDAAGNVGTAAVSLTVSNAATADTTPPVVSITNPISGATLSGTFAVQGTATDNVGVKTIQFYVDGGLISSITASPFGFTWNSTAVANGSHTLTVKAYDAANNVGSASISVNISNDKTAPTVSIATPLTGTTVSGTISVNGTATDNVGVTKVQFFVDGVATGSGTASSFSFSWNTTTATNASHTLTVKAYDAAGNVGSTAITVTVNNPVSTATKDTTPPVVKVTSPTAGAVVSKVTGIGASASDNVAVSHVALYVDNVQVAACSTATCSYSWNTRKVATGTHVIGAAAWDTSGNVANALSMTVTVTR